MLGILGTLASKALPELMTFASKKLLGSNIGQKARQIYNNPYVQQIKRDYMAQMQDAQ